MTRWFYTDPLAAAWQAKHFGMRFEQHALAVHDDESLGRCLDYSNFFFVTMGSYKSVENGERFYVHPDSVPLLVPRKGDWLFQDGDMYKAIGVEDRGEFEGRTIVWYEGEKGWLTPKAKLIRRDGKAFHCPETEPSSDARG